MKISKLISRQILDSRGYPTVETDVYLENGVFGRAAVPSGKSTGKHEALELRDNDQTKFQGKGVLKAVKNVNEVIAPKIAGFDIEEQEKIDQTMLNLDGTENKKNLGANATLSVSLASAKAAAKEKKQPLYEHLKEIYSIKKDPILPLPMINILNGGAHANFETDIQEFMIMPIGAKTFSDAIQMSANVFHNLGKVLKNKGYETLVGDEGGYAPKVKNGNSEAIDLIIEAIQELDYKLGEDFVLAIDAASTQFYKEGMYILKAEGKEFDSNGMTNWLTDLIDKYPIVSVEDGLDEGDWDGWVRFTKDDGNKIQIVGDDLLVTNTKFIQRAIDEKAVNAVLIKPNQIGTLTETANAIDLALDNNLKAIVSHRSGETEDITIAHIVVAFATGQIKTGSLSRTERTAKYNELLRIEQNLGDAATFAGRNALTITP